MTIRTKNTYLNQFFLLHMPFGSCSCYFQPFDNAIYQRNTQRFMRFTSIKNLLIVFPQDLLSFPTNEPKPDVVLQIELYFDGFPLLSFCFEKKNKTIHSKSHHHRHLCSINRILLIFLFHFPFDFVTETCKATISPSSLKWIFSIYQNCAFCKYSKKKI